MPRVAITPEPDAIIPDAIMPEEASSRFTDFKKKLQEQKNPRGYGTFWTTRMITFMMLVVLVFHSTEPILMCFARHEGQKKQLDTCKTYRDKGLTKEYEKYDCSTLSYIFITNVDAISFVLGIIAEIAHNIYLSCTGMIALTWSKVWSVAQVAMTVIAITEGFNRVVALLPTALRPSWL